MDINLGNDVLNLYCGKQKATPEDVASVMSSKLSSDGIHSINSEVAIYIRVEVHLVNVDPANVDFAH